MYMYCLPPPLPRAAVSGLVLDEEFKKNPVAQDTKRSGGEEGGKPLDSSPRPRRTSCSYSTELFKGGEKGGDKQDMTYNKQKEKTEGSDKRQKVGGGDEEGEARETVHSLCFLFRV